MALFRFASSVALAAVVGACSSPAPTAPPASISNLTYSPTVVPVNSLSVIQSTFDFTDSDSDVVSMQLAWVAPNGTHAPTQTLDLPTAKGKSAQTLKGELQVQPPIAGKYTFEVWLVDANGASSNHLSGEITAQ